MIKDDSCLVVVFKDLFCTLGKQGSSKLRPGIVGSGGIIPRYQQWYHCWKWGIIPPLPTMPGRNLEEPCVLVGYNFAQPILNSQAIITYQCWYWGRVQSSMDFDAE